MLAFVPNDLLAYAGFTPNGPLSRSMLAFVPNDLLAYAGYTPNGPLSKSMLAFVPNDLLAYAGFTPNGLYQGLCWPLRPTTSWPMLASRPTASIKVYAGLCTQRPPGLCWLHAQRPLSRSMLAFAPNDLLAYAGFTPNGLYQGLCWPLHPTTSWLHGPLSRSMLAIVPNDLLAYKTLYQLIPLATGKDPLPTGYSYDCPSV